MFIICYLSFCFFSYVSSLFVFFVYSSFETVDLSDVVTKIRKHVEVNRSSRYIPMTHYVGEYGRGSPFGMLTNSYLDIIICPRWP